MQARYIFTFQFLRGAEFFGKEAARLELNAAAVTEDGKTQHRAFVVGAVMQSVSALEAEALEFTRQGPGIYVGSNEPTGLAQLALAPYAKEIDRMRTGLLSRYDRVLTILRKQTVSPVSKIRTEAQLLIDFRNWLVHYESLGTDEMANDDTFKSLRALKHPRAPWVHFTSNFFPHHALSAACAHWATDSAVNYLREVYSLLGLPSDYLDRFIKPNT